MSAVLLSRALVARARAGAAAASLIGPAALGASLACGLTRVAH